MKLSLKISLVVGCVLFAQSTGGAQEPDEFRTAVSGFSIKLPKTFSDYHNLSMEVAKDKFPTRIYRWSKDDEIFTVWFGEGHNDLEQPGYTKSFLDDFRAQYVASLKDIGKVLEEHPWSFNGHPGFELIEEHMGRLASVRVFITGYRFYALIANVASADHQLGEHAKQILASFRLLSPAEETEEKERLIASFAPPPLPQQPSTPRPRSDAQDKNLRDKVRRVYLEEAVYFGEPHPGKTHPVSREDFDDRGNLITRIEYSGSIPFAVLAFGYLNGNRVYRKNSRPPLPEFTWGAVMAPKQADNLFKVAHKYDQTGALDEMKISEPGGAVEKWTYKDAQQQRRIEFTKNDPNGLNYHWKIIIDLDGDENPIAELKTEYFSGGSNSGPGSYVSVERPVNDYDVVSQAIRGQPITSSTGNRNITATDVAKNPNQTERVIQNLHDNDSKQTNLESKYIYKYEEYDSHHNWTKRVIYMLKKDSPRPVPVSINYRTITYY